jgi:hypothetical protein
MADAIPLAGLTWGRPIRGEYVELSEGVIKRPRVRRYKEYQPLKETGLFRIFADAEPTPEGCLRFARAYGFLRRPNGPENIADWLPHLNTMRRLVALWDAARSLDELAVRKSVDAAPDGRVYDDAELWDLYWKNHATAGVDAAFAPTPVSQALAYCAYAVNRFADTNVTLRYRLMWNPAAKQFEQQLSPADLLSALYLQFSVAVAGEKNYHRCPSCGRWFEVRPGVARANKLTCNQKCRTQAYRLRQERARELKAQGKSVQQIARELGAEPGAVKKWVASNKE